MKVLRVVAYAVDDREGEFSFGKIFAETFVFGVLCAREVHVVVADLEKESDYVYQWDTITWGPVSVFRFAYGEDLGVTNILLLLSACMSLTANLNKPPVLFPTISK